MTSRLKRKLEDLGVDTTSRRANENFCLIGTPLPPLEKSKDTGEFVPLWKQEVRDEKGRRRLHGAFTGGFSAGYFNSVGSKEGWAPQTFVSSRSDRAKKQTTRPEDFMDEEDLQDLKDSRNLVDTTEEMDFSGGKQAELFGKADEDSDKDPITRTLEASLLPSPKDSIGARILKKMGWRLGQGIGPRITLKQRKVQDAQAYEASTGAKYSGSTLNIADDDEEASKHTYAPRDTPVLAVKRKDNTHGLGYVPGLTLDESLGNIATEDNKGPTLAGGFGLGALNDADEDDLDVYDSAQKHSRRRVAYDHLSGEGDDTIVVGSRADKQQASMPRTSSTVLYFRDGRPLVAGFVLSDKRVAEDRWFPLPDVPPGWKPDPRRVWAKDKENTQAPPPPPAAAQSHAQWMGSKISAAQRGELLGETPLAGPPRSVFDYMSQKDKERIQKITSGLKSSRLPETETTAPSPLPSFSAKLEPHLAQAALKGFQPFTSDPAKQARYNAYLWSQADVEGSFPPLQPMPGQSRDEFNKEMGDYAKAASLFKPISGAMAGRFTSAAVIDFGPKVQEGLHTPTNEEIAAKEAQERKEAEDKISPKAHAAKMGMYGSLTREKKLWQPARLLCKRFGVKDPNPEPEIVSDPAVAASSSTATASFTHSELQKAGGSRPVADTTTPMQTRDGPRDLANIGLGEDEMQGQDTLTYERPSMDIFKAIFASDDEDSEQEEREPEEDNEVAPFPTTKDSGDGFTPATVIFDDSPVDINTFKPTFIPREGKSNKPKKEDKSKHKKDKKRKEKKNVLVSFEMEGDGAEGAELRQPKDRPKKKRKDKIDIRDDNEQAVWAAPKSPPSGLPQPSPSPAQTITPSAEREPKGRKRAIDFM